MRAVDVEFDTKTARVEMKPGASLTADAVNARFQGTPYKVKTLTETP